MFGIIKGCTFVKQLKWSCILTTAILMTHEEIISHIQAQRNKLNIKDMAKEIGISYQYLNDVIKKREIKGKVRKLNETRFPKIIAYLNDLTICEKQHGE